MKDINFVKKETRKRHILPKRVRTNGWSYFWFAATIAVFFIMLLELDQFKSEAISRGYGKWNQEWEYTGYDFKWIEPKLPEPVEPIIEQIVITNETVVTNEVIVTKVVTNEIIVREGFQDIEEVGDELGLDIEEMVVGAARVTIQDSVMHVKDLGIEKINWNVFNNYLKRKVEESIRKEFDGFKTYNNEGE